PVLGDGERSQDQQALVPQAACCDGLALQVLQALDIGVDRYDQPAHGRGERVDATDHDAGVAQQYRPEEVIDLDVRFVAPQRYLGGLLAGVRGADDGDAVGFRRPEVV